MNLLTRQEYNLILGSFDKYDVYMNTKERELREQLEEKLYNELVKEFNNQRMYYFNDSYTIED